MTNPQSEDLVGRLREAASYNHRISPVSGGIFTEAADLIEQLEREKVRKEKALEVCKRLACQEGDEADTLARYTMYGRMTMNNVPVLGQDEIKQALTIAKRRVNGE